MRSTAILAVAACVLLVAATASGAEAVRAQSSLLSVEGGEDLSAAKRKAKKSGKKKKGAKARRGSDINRSGARPAPARSNRP